MYLNAQSIFVTQSDIQLVSDESDETDIGFDRGASMHQQDLLHSQDATQSRERSKLLLRKLSQTRERERGKEREQERERLHQLQSINNLLLDLPSPPSPSHLPTFSQDAFSSSSQSDKNISNDGKRENDEIYFYSFKKKVIISHVKTPSLFRV